MSIPSLAIPGLPGKHCRQFTGCRVFPPALPSYGWKQAGVEDHPWICSSCLSIASCQMARHSSVCINILLPTNTVLSFSWVTGLAALVSVLLSPG